jgi:hypothetical protein
MDRVPMPFLPTAPRQSFNVAFQTISVWQDPGA